MPIKKVPCETYSIQSARPTHAYGSPAKTPVGKGKAVYLVRAAGGVGLPRYANITRATLEISQWGDTTGTRKCQVRPLKLGFGSKVTWKRRPPLDPAFPAVPLQKRKSKGRTVWAFDVTKVVQANTAGERDPHGWELATTDDWVMHFIGARTSIASTRPALVVEYSLVPEPPENLHPQGLVSATHPWLSFDGDNAMTALEVEVLMGLEGGSPPGTPLVAWDFEDDTYTGWTPDVGIAATVSTDFAHQGTKSLHAQRTGNETGAVRYQAEGLTKGHEYVFTGWCYLPAETGVSNTLGVNGLGWLYTDIRDEWVYVEHPFTVGSDPITLSLHGGATAGDVGHYYDEVALYDIDDYRDPAVWWSGPIAASGGLLDLEDERLATPFPGLAGGQTVPWRAKQKTAGGWSEWSEWVDMTRAAKPPLVITSPVTEGSGDPGIEVVTNQFANPSAESENPTNMWSPTTPDLTEAEFRTGTRSWVIDDTQVGTGVGFASQEWVGEATQVTAAFWIKAPAGVEFTSHLGGSATSDEPAVHAVDQPFTGTGDWQLCALVATVSATPEGDVWLHPVHTVATPGQTVYVDNLSITTGGEPADFDGDTTDTGEVNYEWTGAAHESTSTATTIIEAGSEAEISDGTPVFAWEFSGTQTAYRVIFMAADGEVFDDSEYTPGDAQFWSPNAGFVKDGDKGVVIVRVWDDSERVASPGDPEYVEASLELVYTLNPEIEPVDSIEAISDGYNPRVKITGTALNIPDQIDLFRKVDRTSQSTEGFKFRGRYNAADVFEPDGTFTLWDYTAPQARGEVHYRVAPRRNGKTGKGGPIASVIPECKGIWIYNPETDQQVVLRSPGKAGEREAPEQEQPEQAIVHYPLQEPSTNKNYGQVVRRRIVRNLAEGTINGIIWERVEPLASIPNARTCEARLRNWAASNDAGHQYWIQFAGFCELAIIGDVTFKEREPNLGNRRVLDVTLKWWDQYWNPKWDPTATTESQRLEHLPNTESLGH